MGLDIFFYKKTDEDLEKVMSENESLLYLRKVNVVCGYCSAEGFADTEMRYAILGVDDLQVLVDKAKEVLNEYYIREEKDNWEGFAQYAEDILPTYSGFFFGTTEYDYGYYDQLEKVVEGVGELVQTLRETKYEDEILIEFNW